MARRSSPASVKGLPPLGEGRAEGPGLSAQGATDLTSVAPKRLYNVEESARYLALSQWTVRDLVAGGKLPAVRVGRRVLLDIRDLDSWIDREKTRAETW